MVMPSPKARRVLVSLVASVGLATTALTGCQKSDTDTAAQLTELRAKAETQTRQNDTVNQALLQHDTVISRFEYTEFDPAKVRYFSLNNGVVSLIGQLVQVKPLPDGKGSAVTLRIANNAGLTVFNPGFMAQWGDAMPGGKAISAEQVQQWRKGLHTSEFRGQMQLIPGNWTEMTLTLDGVLPEQLHFLRLTMLMDQVEFGGALVAAPAENAPNVSTPTPAPQSAPTRR